MIRRQVPGNEILAAGANPAELERASDREGGFTLIEVLVALFLLAGTFITLAGALPLAALVHRTALEKEIAGALVKNQMEFFLANPGPVAGQTGSTANFVNAAQFPPGYVGSFSASSFGGVAGLTQIVVSVTPPHAPKVEISAIDTTFSNLVP